MAWVNYRKILGRFGHIDAEFVRASTALTPEGGTAEVVVRFYPWWEHPLYLAARERGEPWGFSSRGEGVRDVTVRAIQPSVVRVSQRQSVTALGFTDSHPILRDSGFPTTIYVNEAFDPERLLDQLLGMRLPFVSRKDLLPYVDSRATPVPRAVSVPTQLHRPFIEAFERLGVQVFAPEPRGTVPRASVFLMDGEDYIVADDFEVFVPEFTHDAAWFTPQAPSAFP
ncbi:MAG TPA: hypothetical protein VFJ16_22860 [Longimicrobium sp.]|nr:hypothetical protein [Longimicrobium sp.]